MIKEERRLDKKRRPAFNGIMVDGGDVEYGKWRRHLVAIHVCEDLGIVLLFIASCIATVRLNVCGRSFVWE